MKILDAKVYDPTIFGKMERPVLVITVDHWPDVTIPEEQYEESSGHAWRVSKLGPFIRYQTTTVYPAARLPDAGDFNRRFTENPRFPPVVDIMLKSAFNAGESRFYALPLDRARHYLKKYDPNWRLLIADKDAQNGKLIWVPVERDPKCKWKASPEFVCGNRPTVATIRVKDVELQYCKTHIEAHNRAQAQKRVSLSSK